MPEKKPNLDQSQVGVVGDHAHVEGGIHFHGSFARLNHWRRQHPFAFYPALILAILLVMLFAATVVGANFPGARQQFIEWGLWPRTFPKEREGEVLIVIATFHRSEGVADTEPYVKIRRAIEAAREELGFTNLRVQVEPTRLTADDYADAEALGDRYDASLVIWGEDTGVEVVVNFFNRKQPGFHAAKVEIQEATRTQIVSPSAYAEFITQDLPGQLTFLSLFALGQSYIIEEAYPESAQVIEKAVSLLREEPTVAGAAEAYFTLGWLYQEPLGNFERATTNYDRAIELDPQYVEAYNNRGTAYSALQDYAQAIKEYDQALALNPQLAIAYNNRGTAYSALQDYARAIEDYDQALTISPEDAVVYYNRGLAYTDLQNYAQAIQDYDQALTLNPQLAEAYGSRGLVYYDLQDYGRAIQDYSQALALNPQLATAYYNRGLAYSALQDYPRAIEDYNQALIINPQDAQVYNNRGTVYHDLQEYAHAIEDYDQALAIDSQYAKAYNNRGLAYAALQDYVQAVEDYDQALALNPQYADAYNNRGLAYAALQDYVRAIEDYDQALTIDSQCAKAFYNRGNAYKALQDYVRAIQDYDQALALNPGYAQAYNNRGTAYVALQDYTRAIEDYIHSAELAPHPLSYYNIAWVYALENQADIACPWLEKAIALDAQYRDYARTDSDFDRIRAAPCFQALMNDE